MCGSWLPRDSSNLTKISYFGSLTSLPPLKSPLTLNFELVLKVHFIFYFILFIWNEYEYSFESFEITNGIGCFKQIQDKIPTTAIQKGIDIEILPKVGVELKVLSILDLFWNVLGHFSIFLENLRSGFCPRIRTRKYSLWCFVSLFLPFFNLETVLTFFNYFFWFFWCF